MAHNSFPNVLLRTNLALPAENVAQPANTFDSGLLFPIPSNNVSGGGSLIFEVEPEQPTVSGGTTFTQGPQHPPGRVTQRQSEHNCRKKLRNAYEKLARTLSYVGVSVQGRANTVDLSARLIEAMVKRIDPAQLQAALYELQLAATT